MTKKDIESIQSLQNRIERLRRKFDDNDVALQYGNGSVGEQLDCASAALECILQEF